MPGLYGLIRSPGEEGLAPLALRMAESMRHHPWYTQAEYLDEAAGVVIGRLSLGILNRETHPARDATGHWHALLEGEIHDDADERRRLERLGCRFSSTDHAEILLQGYIHQGARFLHDLSGSFVAALWNSSERRLVLVNDRFGMKPLYYAEGVDRLVFASELKAILSDRAVSRAMSPRGISQFFMFGQLWNEDTLVQSIRALPAGSLLEYEAASGQVRLETYRGAVETGERAASEEEALERIDCAFGRAIECQTRVATHLGLSLSGGLDSRTILAALDPKRSRVTTVSMGVAGSVDHRSAQEMARIQGCRHHVYMNGEEFLSGYAEHLETMVRLTDGHYLSQCVAEPSIPLYRSLGIDVLMRGHAGELMHLDKAYNFSLDKQAWAIGSEQELEAWLMNRLAAYVSGPEQRTLFAGPTGGDVADHARESLQNSLRASRALDHPVDRIWHLFLTQRLRRETALSLVQFGTQVETRLPLLDGGFVDALFAAPVALRVGDRIQTHLITRRQPAFLNVVNANTGVRLGARPLATSLGRLRMKVLRKLGVPGYRSYEKMGLWLRRELRPLVENLVLGDRSLSRGFFRPDVVRRIAAEHFAVRANHTYLLLVLMVFEMGQRLFFDADPAPVDAVRLAAVGA